MKLKNNTILITGGTSGFGLEFAKRLLELGNTVIVTGRDPIKLASAKKNLAGLHIFQSDVSNPEEIANLYKTVIAQFPKLNVLINNAGQMRKISLHDSSIGLLDITREIETNLMGPIRMVQAFIPHLKQIPSAAILNVTSGLALVPFPISPIYGATKSGLRSYTKSLRVQLKNTRIKVFELIAPAAKTPLNDEFRNLDGYNVKQMNPVELVDIAFNGMEKDKYEIYPGVARVLYFMSRIAPGFMLRTLSKAGSKEMAG
ncbi:SDR family oxidoreductase [Mucilaginibacter lappiensis]|uniref:Putative oxidoreductase n=1 Tax=Mucilaginibacter lappiensis TaxID=354630 RepID=A0A841JE19_9SPHI|nr:SDR family NAD(P)-dependent oxidoreductase [Mucilaginibacter lappiensis]MBB6129399.1 putative oxidoreductase [Mucilaginibacter lappiensis]